MKRTRLQIFTKVLIDIIFYTGILICAEVPLILKFAGKYQEFFRTYYISMTIAFFLSGVFALLIFWELRRIFSTVLSGDPFVMSNVTALKRMGIYSFFVALITATRLFTVVTAAVLVVILVFTIAGLFSLVLAQVFHQAVTYKLENDLTI